MAQGILRPKRDDGAFMNNIVAFEKEEYQKLMDTLGLCEHDEDVSDYSEYFNAWNFGQTENDFEYSITSSLPICLNT